MSLQAQYEFFNLSPFIFELKCSLGILISVISRSPLKVFFFPLQVFFFHSIDFPKNRKKEEKDVSFPRQKAKVSTNTDGLA